jgi:cell division protease FtsH
MESAKKEAWELVSLLKDRNLLKAIGGKIVKGTMMIGPPGCGKTYLAKAIATECGLPMLSVSGSDFVGIFVGQGAAQMKAVFKQARGQAEIHGGCLIFIDEIDSFARPRMADTGFGGGISHNATINTFLTEMDGLRKTENNIVVIAATNMGEHELDPAIMRAGRFDRKIYITKPNLKERKEVFDFYLKKVKADPDVNSEILARRALYYSPSDIDSMVREAGIIALRAKRDTINMKDLSEAYDRVTYGNKSNINMTDEDKKWTAYHESGHAILACLHPQDDVVKATIIPRKGFLGFVSHKPRVEYYSRNKENLLAQIKICLASYAAEEITFGSTTTGVGGGPGSDFYTAIDIARDMVWSYGMGKSGHVGDFQSYSYYNNDMVSDETKKQLEDDVQHILRTCMQEVKDYLNQHRDLLNYFAEQLIAKEELEYDEIQQIFEKFGIKTKV